MFIFGCTKSIDPASALTFLEMYSTYINSFSAKLSLVERRACIRLPRIQNTSPDIQHHQSIVINSGDVYEDNISADFYEVGIQKLVRYNKYLNGGWELCWKVDKGQISV